MGPGAGRRRSRAAAQPPCGRLTARAPAGAVPGRSRAPAPPPGRDSPSYTGISSGPAGQLSPISPLSSRILASLVL